MVDGLSTVLVIFLLVLVASLASYLLSQSGFIRSGGTMFAWASISTGTTLLLAAVVIVVLAITFFSKLRLVTIGTDATQAVTLVTLTQPDTRPNPFREGVPADTNSVVQSDTPQVDSNDRTSGRTRREGRSPRAGNELETQPTASSVTSKTEPQSSANLATRVGSVGVLAAADPWAATKCVVPIHGDPADLIRWKVVNDCGVPVGIVIATCSLSEGECNAQGTKAWKYQLDGMILPAKPQRSVSETEETVRAGQLHHLACAVTNPGAIKRIGKEQVGPSPSSREDFAPTRMMDDCLVRVRELSIIGQSTGLPIDVLLAERPVNAAQ
jgi:hypothetical protein